MRSTLGCDVRRWICNIHSSRWGKARFLYSPRQGRGGSARARTATCVKGRQRALGMEGREGESLGVKNVTLSMPTSEILSTITVSDSFHFMSIMGLHSRTPPRKSVGIPYVSTRFSLSMEMGRMARDGTAKLVSRDQILWREQVQENINFPCSADYEHDWQAYSIDLYFCYM